MEQYAKENGNVLHLTGKKFFIYFQQTPLKVKTGDTVVVKCKFSGKGQIKLGYLSYTDYGYGGLNNTGTYVKVKPGIQECILRFQIKDPSIKQIRPMMMVLKDTEAKITDYQIQIKK